MLRLLLPQRCLACSQPGAQVCRRCTERLRRIEAPLCERCGAPTAWPVARCRECSGRRLAFARVRAAVEYDDAVRPIVTAWKERGLRRLTGWAADVVFEVIPRPNVDLVAVVPPDPDRLLKRGHHAAGGLARELATRWELPFEPMLRRTRPAPRQRGLDHLERHTNVRGAFAAGAPVRGAVLVVDDVYTTGATANAAASVLRAAGARKVEVATFARAILLR